MSDAYKQCQIRLLKGEISNKKFVIRKRQSKLVLLKKHLKASKNVIDYVHIFSIFLISKDKVLTKQKDVHNHKISGLIKGKGIDPEKVIFNFSSYVLSDNDKSLLSKDLNFSFPNKKVEIWNTFVLLSYFIEKIVILAKKEVIKNFSKVN